MTFPKLTKKERAIVLRAAECLETARFHPGACYAISEASKWRNDVRGPIKQKFGEFYDKDITWPWLPQTPAYCLTRQLLLLFFREICK